MIYVIGLNIGNMIKIYWIIENRKYIDFSKLFIDLSSDCSWSVILFRAIYLYILLSTKSLKLIALMGTGDIC